MSFGITGAMYSLCARAGMKSLHISSKLCLMPSTCWLLLRSCTSNLSSGSSSSLLSYSIWSKIFLMSSNSFVSDLDSILILENSIIPSSLEGSSGMRSLPKKSNAGTASGTVSCFSSSRSISTSSISRSTGAYGAISSRCPIWRSRFMLAVAKLLPKLMLSSLLL